MGHRKFSVTIELENDLVSTKKWSFRLIFLYEKKMKKILSIFYIEKQLFRTEFVPTVTMTIAEILTVLFVGSEF